MTVYTKCFPYVWTWPWREEMLGSGEDRSKNAEQEPEGLKRESGS